MKIQELYSIDQPNSKILSGDILRDF